VLPTSIRLLHASVRKGSTQGRLVCLHSRQLSILISTFPDAPVVALAVANRLNDLLGRQGICLLANVLQYLGSVHRNMFKISIADTPSRRTLLVEGTLIGPWVAELGTTWRNASQELGGRKLMIDLTNVTVISHEGENAIFDLMNKGANFSCGGVLIKHVLKELARKKQQESPRR